MRVLKLGCLVTFSRVLVDVDMSGKLFDSVLVEKEGRDFLVAIEYEKQPLFCLHCKILGHSIQQCKKLISIKALVDFMMPKKTHPSHDEQSTKTTCTRAHNLQPDAHMVSTKPKVGPAVQVIDSPEIAHVESSVEVTTFHTSNIVEPKNLSVLDEESEPVSLHNSFDILNTDDDVSYGEALGPDLNPHDSSAGKMTVN